MAGLRAAAHFTMGGIPINERAEISLAALHREESRGAHYRADHPEEKPNGGKTFTLKEGMIGWKSAWRRLSRHPTRNKINIAGWKELVCPAVAQPGRAVGCRARLKGGPTQPSRQQQKPIGRRFKSCPRDQHPIIFEASLPLGRLAPLGYILGLLLFSSRFSPRFPPCFPRRVRGLPAFHG